MKKIVLMVGFLLMTGMLLGCQESEQAKESTRLTGDTDAVLVDWEEPESYTDISDFGYELMQKNLDPKSENPVLSPLSAYIALSMAMSGAEGETYREFQQVLGDYPLPQAAELMHCLPADTPALQLDLANAVWIDEGFAVKQDWLDCMEGYYCAQVYQEELSAQDAMEHVNVWADEATRGLIPEFLKEPFSKDTRLVLLNSLYFKGKWQIPFEMNNTVKREFYRQDGTTKEVDMMSMTEHGLSYIQNEMAEGILLPYKGSTLAMVALKPTKGTVRELYQALDSATMNSLLETEKQSYVNLWLPKFNVEFDQILNSSLQKMGICRAFEREHAEFNRLGEDIYISVVRQNAVVIVDEEGTEAAAVTLVECNDACEVMDMEEPLELHFDEPFIYMIMDLECQVPLFMGIIDQP